MKFPGCRRSTVDARQTPGTESRRVHQTRDVGSSSRDTVPKSRFESQEVRAMQQPDISTPETGIERRPWAAPQMFTIGFVGDLTAGGSKGDYENKPMCGSQDPKSMC